MSSKALARSLLWLTLGIASLSMIWRLWTGWRLNLLASAVARQMSATTSLSADWWLHALPAQRCTQTPTRTPDEQARLRGMQMLTCGDHANASKLLNQAQRTAPHQPTLALLLAAADWSDGASAPSPENWRGVIGWRIALDQAERALYEGKKEEARRWLDLTQPWLAQPVQHDLQLFYFFACYLNRELGQLETSLAACNQHIAIDANDKEAWNSLGLTLRRLGRPDEAEAAFRRAATLTNDWPEPYLNLGDLLQATGRADEAQRSYEAGLDLDPKHPILHDHLARLALDSGLCSLAREHAQAGIEIGSPDQQAAASQLLADIDAKCKP